ncbi:MAG: hypothetical protein RL238_361 [Actinomycetota bacterium]|jgi:hypothetical protein
MKKITTAMVAIGATVSLGLLTAAAVNAGNGNGMNGNGMRGNGAQSAGQMQGTGVRANGMQGNGMMDHSAITYGTTATDAETATLLHMVEEEKLAHDVYIALADETGLRIFDRIAASEAKHTDVVRALLEARGIDDPTAGNAAGEFTDPAFDALYTDLVEQGSASVDAALQVGVQIEELDIADLKDAIAESGQADIDTVYGNLLTASGHHLTAFENQLS